MVLNSSNDLLISGLLILIKFAFPSIINSANLSVLFFYKDIDEAKNS